MSAAQYDIAIIGAGPCGSACAAQLARSGFRVLLLERDTFPRDKLCGEFLSGESRRLLAELGCLQQVEQRRPASIQSMKFISMKGAETKAHLPSPAYGISRRSLDTVLVENAAASGAEVWQGREVLDLAPRANRDGAATLTIGAGSSSPAEVMQVSARVVIAAYGRRSHLDRKQGRGFLQGDHPFMGLKRHYRLKSALAADELHEEGEVYAFTSGYCGICRIEDGLVNVCMLFDRKLLTGGRAAWDSMTDGVLSGNGKLQRRLLMLDPTEEPIQSVAQVPFETKELWNQNIFYVGDAAGMIAPLCGDGQAMALDSAARLSSLLSAQWSSPVHVLGREWERSWRSAYSTRLIIARTLQKGLLSRSVSNLAIEVLCRLPQGATDTLAKVTRG